MALKEDGSFLKLMDFDHFYPNPYKGLMSIKDLRALRLRKKKIEREKKARKYILDINQRFMKMKDDKSNKFLKNINLF